PIQADRPLRNRFRCRSLPVVYTGIYCFRVLICFLPEWVLDDSRSVKSDSKLQKQDLSILVSAQEIRIPFCCPVPSFIFHKGIVCAQIHCHRFPAFRTVRDKIRRDLPFWHCSIRQNQFSVLCNLKSLCLYHLPNHFFIFIIFRMARLTALEQPIIPLGVEKAVFLRSCLLKSVIYVGSQVILVFVF